MKNHIELVHEGEEPYEVEEPFHCNIFDAGFVSEADLNRLNADVHEGRKVQCDFCVSSFTNENNFKNHVEVVHKGKNPIPCIICDTSA